MPAGAGGGSVLVLAAQVQLTAVPGMTQLEDLARTLWTALSQHWTSYALAFAAIFAATLARKVIADWAIHHLTRLSRSTATEIDDRVVAAIRRPLGFAVLVAGLAVAIWALPLSGEAEEVCERLLGVLVVVLVSWAGFNLCDVVAFAVERLTARTASRLDDQLVPIVRRSLKVFVALMAFILVVQNLGYPVGALLAGFSLGGAALALASQDTLQNFFGSIMIFLDRPFQVGDWIQVGDIEGVVEEVGLRSTRIRTFAKTLITVPNSKIAHQPINNFSRMPKRRVVQTVGIGYDTEPERVRAVVDAFRRVLAESPEVDQDFWMVNFSEFGDSALEIFVYYFTRSTVWTEYMRIKEQISLRFMEVLAELGVEIAFPTRTVYVRREVVPPKPPLEQVRQRVAVPAGHAPLAPSADDADAEGNGGEG
ncbi:MAG: putative MscS family protein YhdY [Planctomycetota bacterium]|nr:MAG: putative MscS family protein YhdY [Planctomycetota bacterium]